jgi:Flp pilus assembly pilin Flp
MKKLQTAIGMRLALALTGVTPLSLKREEGQTFVEYALILALIAVLVTGALLFLKDQINALFTSVGNQL